MRKEDFPKEATSDNVADMLKKGREIWDMIPEWARKKGVKGFLVDVFFDLFLFFLFFSVFYFVLAGLSLAVLYFVFNISLVEPLPEPYRYPFVAVVLLIAITSTYLSFRVKKNFYRWMYYERFHFPRAEFKILSRGALLAENLLDGNRRLAKRSVRQFTRAVKEYLDAHGDLRKYLNPEAKSLQMRYLLGRTVLYSENSELPYIFLNIGLSFIHEDFSRIFSLIGNLKIEMKKFEVLGKTETIMNFVEKYMESIRNLMYVALVLVIVVVWVTSGYIPSSFP